MRGPGVRIGVRYSALVTGSITVPRVAVIALVVVAMSACGGDRKAPDQDIEDDVPASAPVTTPPVDPGTTVPPPSVDATAPPPHIDASPPPDAAAATAACNAPADRCCSANGAIVTPGGCAPSYRDGVEPATERGPDGWCRRIPCYKKCLPLAGRIATPDGDVAVRDLEAGDVVWTAGVDGGRVAVALVRVGRAQVHGTHELVELTLDDGRVVAASAGHPTASGAVFGELRPGAVVDGARIVEVRAVPYTLSHTGDILPAGSTGTYWLDGVLVASTLR